MEVINIATKCHKMAYTLSLVTLMADDYMKSELLNRYFTGS